MADIVAVPIATKDGRPADNNVADEKNKALDIEHVEGGLESVKTELITEDANKAEDFEHEMTTWQAFKIYRMAVFWSVVASMSIIMEGYDWGLQGNLWGMIEYRKTFGSYYPELDDWQPTAAWQSAIAQAPSIGAIFGVYWGAWLNDRYGYRWSLMINYAICIPIVFLFFFAHNKEMLLMAGLLIGLPFGCFACLGEAYASEICPIRLRAYMTGYVNICWNIGGFVSSGIINATQTIPNNWSWRIPYATQWAWPIPLIILSFLAPESPWWLVRHGKLKEAERSVRRLGGKTMQQEHRAQEQVANMVRTTALEKELAETTGQGKWIDIFKRTDLRRTEITVFVWVLQNFSGAMFAGNTTYVFQQAGISQQVAYDLGWGTSAIQLGANFLNMFLLYHLGRRTIYISGFIYCTINLLIVGVAAVYGIRGSNAARWVQAGVQMAFMIGYTGFLGPTCYAIIGETSSTRLRNKTLAFARMCYSIQGIVFNILNAYMINPTAFGWQGKSELIIYPFTDSRGGTDTRSGKTAFFWAPCAALSAVWCWYRLPELKDRSYYEINLLFAKKIPAREFKKTVIDHNSEEAIRERALPGH